MRTGAPIDSDEFANNSERFGLEMTIWRHSKPIRHLQLRFSETELSLFFDSRLSASASRGLNKFKPMPKLLMIKMAHFIWRTPIMLFYSLAIRIGSRVGAIYSSKMLAMSGMNLKISFVMERHKLIKSRTTHLEKGLDLKLNATC